MNLAITLNIRFVAFARYRILAKPNLPDNRPVILVANHQSMYDIPMIMWELRSREVGFISKRELGKWIPSISFALRTLSSVLIDRKDARGSIQAIKNWGEQKETAKGIAGLFPEGTRARDGVLKPFKSKGFSTLYESMPTAAIQPVVVRGNWELLQFGFLPVPVGVDISLEFLEVIERGDRTSDQVLEEVYLGIQGRLNVL